MKRYRYWILDWDGCLCDTLGVWLKAYKLTYAEFGLNPEEKQIVAHFGDWEGPKKNGVVDIEKYNRALMARVGVGMKQAKLHQGVRETLAELDRGGCKMVIATSSLREVVEPMVEEQGLERWIEVVLDAGDVKQHKPDPEVVELAIEKLGAVKEMAVMVGDTDKDVVAAQAAGVASVWFYPKANWRFYERRRGLAVKPDYVVEEFGQLAGLAKR